MSRTSTVTVRDAPLTETASATGPISIRSQNITIDSRERVQIFDLTDEVMAFVRSSGVREGLLSVSSLHTTCAIFINEFQAALLRDIQTFLERTVETDGPWTHNDPVHSDCDRGNADSHLRAMMLGHTLTLQVSGRDVVLGQWQRVLAAELDGPRVRSIRLSIMGVA
jgi:secondary thiamine-phosphate synthase enzyme